MEVVFWVAVVAVMAGVTFRLLTHGERVAGKKRDAGLPPRTVRR